MGIYLWKKRFDLTKIAKDRNKNDDTIGDIVKYNRFLYFNLLRF